MKRYISQLLASPMPYRCPNMIVIKASLSVVCIQTTSSLNKRANLQMASPANLKMRSNLYAGNSIMIICIIIVNNLNVTGK
jgi:hypothetical protein